MHTISQILLVIAVVFTLMYAATYCIGRHITMRNRSKIQSLASSTKSTDIKNIAGQ